MPVDPSIITDVLSRWQSPASVVQLPDPLASFAKLQALKAGITDQQLNQARLADYQAQADQRRADLADAQALMRGLQDPDTAKKAIDWQPGQPIPIAGISQPKTWQDFRDKVITDKSNALKLSNEQLQAADALHGKFSDMLYPLAYNKDGTPRSDTDIARDAPGVWQGAIAQGLIPPGTPQPAISGFQDLQGYLLKNNYAKAIGQSAQAALKEKQAIDTSATDAAKNLANAAEFSAQAQHLRATLPKDQADAQIAQAEADFRKAHNGLSAKELADKQIQQGQLAVSQANSNREDRKFQAEYGTPVSRQMYVQSVLRDPDSYFSLSPQMKTGVANDLIAMGYNVPVQLPSDAKTRAISADLGLAAIARVRQLLNDPDLKNAIGPISGRLGNIEQNIGDTFFGQGTAQAAKEQELRTNLATLKYLETKGLLGGRPASKMIDGLTSVMASPEKAAPLMQGSLDAITANLNNVKSEARAYAMGGASGPGAQGANLSPAAQKLATAPIGPDGKSAPVQMPNGTYLVRVGPNVFKQSDAQGNILTGR